MKLAIRWDFKEIKRQMKPTEIWVGVNFIQIKEARRSQYSVYDEQKLTKSWIKFGGVAQLGEHLPCKQGVRSSILLISTRRHIKTSRPILEVCTLKTKQCEYDDREKIRGKRRIVYICQTPITKVIKNVEKKVFPKEINSFRVKIQFQKVLLFLYNSKNL